MKLSPESIVLCNAGPFEAADLEPFLCALTSEIAEYGEGAVVERCQIARAACASGTFAVECAKSYFGAPADARMMSEMARRAMTEAERETAGAALAKSLTLLRSPAIKVNVTSRPV